MESPADSTLESNRENISNVISTPGGSDPTWKRLFNDIRDGDISFNQLIETLFRIESRGSTVSRELYAGVVHFLSVSTILAVNPSLLMNAGYDKDSVAAATALASGTA